jgi:hypothetical protein
MEQLLPFQKDTQFHFESSYSYFKGILNLIKESGCFYSKAISLLKWGELPFSIGIPSLLHPGGYDTIMSQH